MRKRVIIVTLWVVNYPYCPAPRGPHNVRSPPIADIRRVSSRSRSDREVARRVCAETEGFFIPDTVRRLGLTEIIPSRIKFQKFGR